MDVAFPYKEAIANAYGLIDHTTTHVASRSLLYPKSQSINQSNIIYFTVHKCMTKNLQD